MEQGQISALTPSLFLKMVFTGGKHIIQSESELNQLNVYPVPDGDTGSNMSALMRYIVAQTYPTKDFGSLLTALADASLIGSCGNSGMILSAFFVGLANWRGIAEKTTLSISDFVDCLGSGVDQAHKAVAHPVEGTILTVMKSWLNACVEARNQHHHFTDLFVSTLPTAEKTLTQTEFLLPVLQENHVIDAGAFGFTKFLQGMQQALLNPAQADTSWEIESAKLLPASHPVHHAELSPDAYRFCMETLLSNTSDNLDALRQKMEPICDSIVLNQSPSHLKAHVHTTDIMRCTEILKECGNIIYQKIDDIKMMWEVSEHRKHKIALVTDSSADLPQLLRDNEQIHSIPIQVRIGEDAFLDRLTVNLNTLFEKAGLPGYKTSTAAPSAEIIRRYLQFLATHYESIIIFSLSSRLSSTYQVLCNQAEFVSQSTGVKIDVIDSHTLCSAHGLLLMKAAHMLDQGSTHDEIVRASIEARDQVHIYVAINEMKTMRESGRLSKFMHKVADWGHVKPILTLDQTGQVSLAAVALGKQKAWNKIVALLEKALKATQHYTLMISHTSSKENIEAFVQQVRSKTGAVIKCICDTAPSIGVHAGRGAIAVAVINEEL